MTAADALLMPAAAGTPQGAGAGTLQTAAAGALQAVCRHAAQSLVTRGYELPSVYLQLDGRLRCVVAIGYYQVVDGYPPGVGVIGGVVATGEARLIRDVTATPEFIAARPDVRSEACVPILAGKDIVGAVNVESTGSLPEHVLTDLRQAAGELAAWIVGHGGMPAVPPAQRLARVAVELTRLTTPADIERRAVSAAVDLSGMSSAAIVRADGEQRSVTACHGPLGPAMQAWSSSDIGVISRSVAAGTSSHIARGGVRPAAYDFLERAGVAVFTAQPMTTSAGVLGVLITADSSRLDAELDSPAAEREAVLELLAAQTAAALGMADALRDLTARSLTDPLTGLRNAAAFAEDLGAAARAAARQRLPARACVLLDIDEFKAVNDTRGHVAGDELLSAVAVALRKVLRASDTLYRIGGDEFAALVHVNDEQDMRELADRLVVAVRHTTATVSAGAARMSPDARAVRVQADTALYAAKRAGRDRTVVALP